MSSLLDPSPSSKTAEISREEIRRRLHDPSLILVDVLPRDAYVAEHIPGALSLPLTEIPTHAHKVLPDRAAETVVYCAKFT